MNSSIFLKFDRNFSKIDHLNQKWPFQQKLQPHFIRESRRENHLAGGVEEGP